MQLVEKNNVLTANELLDLAAQQPVMRCLIAYEPKEVVVATEIALSGNNGLHIFTTERTLIPCKAGHTDTGFHPMVSGMSYRHMGAQELLNGWVEIFPALAERHRIAAARTSDVGKSWKLISKIPLAHWHWLHGFLYGLAPNSRESDFKRRALVDIYNWINGLMPELSHEAW